MSIALLIFAKAPVAGLAKTRLIPALGATGAAALAARLLEHAVGQALLTSFDHLELCVTPDTSHAAFRQLAAQAQGRLQLSEQGDGDLGARMARALQRALTGHERALLIGTDAPGLDCACLNAAAMALKQHDAVFVPALDGGYALTGLTRPAPELFAAMPWSTPQVMHLTRARARAAGLRWHELPPLADIDEAPDLIHLPAAWQA